MQNDLDYATAKDAVIKLRNIGADTTPATEPLERWTRVRTAVRKARIPDAANLWDAVASGDDKKISKAATEYMAGRAILDAAGDDPRKEDPFRAATMSILKTLTVDNLEVARDQYNAAAADYTQSFREAGNHPDPSVLIVSEGGATIWANLLHAAKDMTDAAEVIKLGAQFGKKVNDQGTGLGQQVPFVTNLPDVQAVTRAKDTDWLSRREHAPHQEWAQYLLAGGELYAGSIDEQRIEVQRLIDQAEDKRRMPKLADMMHNEQRALDRAMKSAQKRGQA